MPNSRFARCCALTLSLCAAFSLSARAPDYALDLKALDEDLRQIMATGVVPALAVGIVYQGNPIYLRTLGERVAGSDLAIDAHTRFRIASMSKPMAAALTGKLVQQGYLRWDTPVSLVVPAFRLKDPNSLFLSVSELLSHRSGLAHHTLDDEMEAASEIESIRALLPKQKSLCPIGSCFQYQNVVFNYTADVVYAVTGNFFDAEMKRQLFEPIGMQRANIGLDALSEDDNWARPHVRQWQRGIGGVNVPVAVKPNYYWLPAAAGVNASLSDMTQWLIALLGHKPEALSEDVVAELARIQIVTPRERLGVKWRLARLDSASYGLGLRIFDYKGHRILFHAGAVQGYRGMFVVAPDKDAAFVVMWNAQAGPPASLVPRILDRWFNQPAVDWLNDG
jgi:beta-lactamase class C